MRSSITLGATIGVVCWCFSVDTRADEEKIALDKLPAAVLKAVKKKFPKAHVKEAAKEVEDGKTTYEVSIKEDGHGIDVSLKEDGTILEIEKEIAASDLPKAVADALKAKYPKGEIKKAEEIVRGEKTSYEVIILEDGKEREVGIGADGKLPKTDEAEKDAGA